MILANSQKRLLLEIDHLCEFDQLQFVVLTLLTDLVVLPCYLEDVRFKKKNKNSVLMHIYAFKQKELLQLDIGKKLLL